jgi:non-ribosomal peptide synthetase component F
MHYTLTLFDADGASDAPSDAAHLQRAEQRFCQVLEDTLGDAGLVAPVYSAYQRIVGTYGEAPDPEVLSDAERAVFEQWQLAEAAAVTAVFGPMRAMGDATYEIVVHPD